MKPSATRPLNVADLKREMAQLADPRRARASSWFFKTGKGDYGEGDRFLGVDTPTQRKLAKKYRDLKLPDLARLLASPMHEHRGIALMILVEQYGRGDAATKQKIVDFYLEHTRCINNWDLVDSSAAYILGDHLRHRSRKILYRLAASSELWERRIAIIATAAFIRQDDLHDTFAIAKLLLRDDHDLIHKAVGWMLREAGTKSRAELMGFLQSNYSEMPRTALRYAIEHLPEAKRKRALKGVFDQDFSKT
jgi:3-methyladenine DNA glycosylase AlkD